MSETKKLEFSIELAALFAGRETEPTIRSIGIYLAYLVDAGVIHISPDMDACWKAMMGILQEEWENLKEIKKERGIPESKFLIN